MTDAVILVEGDSDMLALEALALKAGRDLTTEGIDIVAMGGASRLGEHLVRLLPDVTIAGLYDFAETDEVRRGLATMGLMTDDLEGLGFYVCVEDLEDELIRALGVEAALEVVNRQGDAGKLRRMMSQPHWRDRPPEAQLRRWIGAGSGRKLRYARAFVEALELDRVPSPLRGVLDSV